MSLLERLARSARHITSPHQPGYNTYSNVDTDPRLWSPPQRPDAPLPDPPQPFDVQHTLERWFEQIQRERGHMHVMLHRLAGERPEFTAVYLKMRELGYQVRKAAGTGLNHDYGMPQTFDPYQPSYWFSDARLIYKVCRLYGIDLAQMTPSERIAAMAYSDGQHAIYAYLQTFETVQPPVLAIDFEPIGPDNGDSERHRRNRRIWTWYAACCLSKYLYDQDIYHGRGAPVEVIAPFDPRRHASFFPLAHSFAKGLLYLNNDCPPNWLCGCNRIEQLLRQVPEDHPWVTGELPGNIVRTMAYEQGYGQAAPPSRGMTPGMTPPRGMSGDLLRQYNEQQREQRRRDTDHGIH